jgi:hypothetical protein
MWSSDDEDLNLALRASQETLIVERNRRQPVLQPDDDSISTDGEQALVVLPPAKRAFKSNLQNTSTFPRLSATGDKPRDAIILHDDESDCCDDDPADMELSLVARLQRKHQIELVEAPSAKKPVTLPQGSNGALEVATVGHSPSPTNTAPPRTELKQQKHTAPKNAPVATSILLNSDDSSDSDDSIKALKLRLAASSERSRPQCSQDIDCSGPSSPSPPARKSTNVSKRKERPAVETKRVQEISKRQKEIERERSREEKARCQQLKAAERQRLKVVKQTSVALEKARKQKQRQASDQARGKFCHKEIAVLIEQDWVQQPVWKEAITDGLVASDDHPYVWHEYATLLGCPTVQWIRKDYLLGGATDAWQQLRKGNHAGYHHIPLLCVIVEPDIFLKLLHRDNSEDDDYPELENWLKGIQAGWKGAWSHQQQGTPRIIILLYKVRETLDRLWVKYKRESRGRRVSSSPQPPTAEELHDALIWMMIDFQVECIHCSSSEQTVHELSKMTRLLSEKPYQKHVTELDCVRKLKPRVDENSTLQERAEDCWFRQLQQIPRISLTVAREFTQHYPTARSLWIAYQNPALSEEQKRVLCKNCFSQKASHAKLSTWMYKTMTGNDPNDLLR